MFEIEQWLPFILAKSHQQSHNLMRSAVEKFNLTPPQFAALAFLWKRDGLFQQELGDLMNVDRTTIGGILERLERLEYVQRGQNPRDRRSWVIFVTRKGNALKEKIQPELESVCKEINKRLTLEEQETLKALLNKLRLE